MTVTIIGGVITASDAPSAPVISGGVIEASAGTEPDEVPGAVLASGAPTITGGAFSEGFALPAVTAYFRADALWREDFTATEIGFFEKDTFSVRVTWHLEDDSPKDLTGADVVARAQGLAGTHDLAATVADAPAGEVMVSAAPETFSRGQYDLQIRVTVGGRTRTSMYSLSVQPSF